MSTAVALGEGHELEGFALAGVTVIAAMTDSEIFNAWGNLGSDVGLLILSARAHQLLRSELDNRPDILTVAMP